MVGVADDRQAAHAVGIEAALPLELLLALASAGVMFFIARMLSIAEKSAFSMIA